MVIPEHLGTDPPKEEGWRKMHFPAILRRLFRMTRGVWFDGAEDARFVDVLLSVFCIRMSGDCIPYFILGYLPGNW